MFYRFFTNFLKAVLYSSIPVYPVTSDTNSLMYARENVPNYNC